MTNVRYLSGFAGSSAFILITGTRNIFATDFRYKDAAETMLKTDWDLVIEKSGRIKTIKNIVKDQGIRTLKFESSASYEMFRLLSASGVRLKPARNIVENLRAIKDRIEISLVKEAVTRAEEAFIEIKPYIKKGVTEKKIAMLLEERLKKKGCNRVPFDIIVASGANSALPHAGASDKKLYAGDLVVIDWGGESGGYFSDMTRTFLLKGGDSAKKKQIYDLVLQANKKAIASIRPATRVNFIDNKARYVIKKAGYAEFFGHGTGHGIGLDVHEKPTISWTKKDKIEQNMIFTVEPGIYIPMLGGVRIEDMALVKRNGVEVLTKLPKDLEII